MKHAIKMFMCISVIHVSSCSQSLDKTYEFHVDVTDEAGNPVQDASVQASKDVLVAGSPIPISDTIKVDAPTDKNGTATIVFDSVHSPGGVAVKKEGYYLATAIANWNFPDGENANNRVKAEIKVVLKSAKKPIPMHADLMTGQKAIIIPEMRKEYGYDLQRAAMVAPLGNGVKSDLLIKIDGDYKNNNGRESKFVATIRFADPNDGLIYFETPNRDRGSEFLGDYSAPQDGYVNSLAIPFDSSEKSKNMSRKNEGNYYFRTRTVRDASGRVVSVNHGKIHGDFMLWSLPLEQGGVAQITWIASYFNPTPNDRNVEFDPKRNLNPDGNVQKP